MWLVATILDGTTQINGELRELLINHNISCDGSYMGPYQTNKS